jgi:Flp pilus assembly protein TadD
MLNFSEGKSPQKMNSLRNLPINFFYQGKVSNLFTAKIYRLIPKHLLTLLVLIMGWFAAPPAWATSAGEYRQQGLAYRQQERFPEAIASLQKAVELEPQNVSGRVLLGWTLHLAGQEMEAANALLMAFYLNPQDVPTLNALGIVYLVSGDLTAAAITHAWAAALQPDNEIAYYNLSLTYQRMQQHDWAIATATRAAELEPTNPHPLVALAIAHWSKGEQPAAKQTYQQALSLDGRFGDRPFLDLDLKRAAFSPEQIQLAKQVLSESE